MHRSFYMNGGFVRFVTLRHNSELRAYKSKTICSLVDDFVNLLLIFPKLVSFMIVQHAANIIIKLILCLLAQLAHTLKTILRYSI